MKLSKTELKAIVKECLIEILNEGIGSSFVTPSSSTFGSKTSLQSPVAKSLSDSVRRPPKPTPHLREAIMREAGGNKVMEAIFADTAASTLPKFLQAGEGKTQMPVAGGGLAEQVVSQATPEDLFGDEVASKWASLAFMESPIKK